MADSLTELMGALCEIRDMDDKLLMVGKVDKIEDHYVQVTRKDSHPSMVDYGTPIKAQIYSVADEFMYIEGSAYLCDKDFLRISDIDFITTEERRNFFRINVNEPASVYGSDDEKIADRLYVPWKEAYVGNISLSGILLYTKEDMEIGEYIMVQLPQLKNQKYVYRIIRKIPPKDSGKRRGYFGYGCELVNDKNHRNSDELCSYIFDRQRNNIGRFKNDT